MIIYGSEHCYKCKQLVEKLKKENKEFTYVDVNTLSDEKILELDKKYGRMLPIVVN